MINISNMSPMDTTFSFILAVIFATYTINHIANIIISYLKYKIDKVTSIKEINEQEGCEYCSFKNTDTNTINTSGDNFVLIKNENEITLATDDKYFRTLKISYCPICGKKLLK